MTGLTFSMLDGRKEKNKQTDKQFSWIILEEARWFSTAISYVLNKHHGLVRKCQNYIMKENDGLYLSLTCWTSLEATTSSSSVETTSKYNSSAIIFKFYSRHSGLTVSVLNPEWSRWICFLWQANTSNVKGYVWC